MLYYFFGYVCAHAMAWVLRSENSSLELVLSCYVGSGAPTRFVNLCLICLCQLSRPSAGPCAPFEVLAFSSQGESGDFLC